MKDLPASFWKKETPLWSTILLAILTLLNLVITNGPAWIQALKKPDPPIKTVTTPIQQSDNNFEKLECASLAPFENYDIKIVEDKIKNKDGIYYPTGSGKTWEGTAWINDALSPTFKKIFIEYEITSDNNYEKPPTFIFTLARNVGESTVQKITKLWAPEFSISGDDRFPQLVGFAKNLDYSEEGLKRETSLSLPDPVKQKQVDSLTIINTNVNGNEMMIDFILNFISSTTSLPMPYPFTRKIVFPFSNLSISNEKLDIGLGTFIKHGLRITTLDICY